MPKYSTFKYGMAKYGKYDLGTSTGKAVGPYVRYRMRHHLKDGMKTEFLRMAQERIDVPDNVDRFRMKCNDGEWVYTQSAEVQGETFKVRIRSIESDGGYSPWLYGEKGNLKLI